MNIKEYLPYYIGRRVLVDGKEYGKLIGVDLVPNSCGQIYYNIQTDEMKEVDGIDFCMPYNDDDGPECRIKPIVRRLSDITGEDVTGFAVAYGMKDFICVKGNYNAPFVQMEYLQKDYEQTDYIYWYIHQLNPRQFHYLLKQGFWLFGDEAFERGEIIDQRTLNQNT